MKDILFQLAFILIFAFVLLAIITFVSGCNNSNSNGKFLGIFGGSSGGDNKIEDGKESLWNAVEGTNWLVTLAIVGMAAGVFAFINGSKIGIPVIASCAVALFMALAVARFAMWMAVFGLIGAVAAVAISVLVKNKALRDVVGNVQKIKILARSDNVDLVFQDKIKEQLTVQAETTKKLVSKIRAKLPIKEGA